MSAVGSSVSQVPLLIASLEKMRAETEEIRARTESEHVRPDHIRAQIATEWERPSEIRQRNFESVERSVKLMAETDRIGEQNGLTRAQIDKVKQEIKNLLTEQEHTAIEVLMTKLHAAHSDLDLIRAFNEATAETSWFKQNVSPYLGDLGKSVGSAYGLRNTIRPRFDFRRVPSRR